MLKCVYNRVVLAMILFIATTTLALGENKIYCSSGPIAPGQVGDVTIALDNSEACFGFQADIQLPELWEFVTENGKPVASLTDRADQSYSLVSNLIDSRNIRVGAFSTQHTPISGNAGGVLNIKVRSLEGFSSGTLKIANAIMVNSDDRDVTLEDNSQVIKYIPVSSITIDKTSASLKIGESLKLNTTILPADATDATVVWSSSDYTVASVDSEGMVTALSVGEGVITAQCGDVSATCTVNVSPIPAESITLNITDTTLRVGEDVTLTATVFPEDATDKRVEWISSDENIVSVDAFGRIIALGLGTTTITAKCGDVTASCTVTVVPIPVEILTINTSRETLKVGESVTLMATVLPENATDRNVVWSSSDSSVATVDADGNVTALELGEAVITVTCGGLSASCSIEVIPTPVEKVSLSLSSVMIGKGDNTTIKATVFPETATDKTVVWSSSDNSIATVDDSGNITAVELGKATITASCGSVSASCEVTVISISVERISVEPTVVSIKAGETVVLNATVLPDNATDKTVKWISMNESIATVNDEGEVTGVSVGNVRVYAECGQLSAGCAVRVLPTPVEKIVLSQTSVELKVGESVELTATVLPENATNKTIEWRSSSSSNVYVDSNGKITAVAAGGAGGAIITAKCDDVSASCVVIVVANPVESISLNQTDAHLKVGESVMLTATVSPENASDTTVTWASDNESVAVVDANGNVTAISVGEANITASCGSVSAVCKVTVETSTVNIPVEQVVLNRESARLEVGESVMLTATVSPENASDTTVTWASDNESVAVVDANGNVTAISVGEANITASCGSVSAVCKVTVETSIVNIPVEQIVLNQESARLKVGESVILVATVTPDDATNKDLSWSSSNEQVATVDQSGKVTALESGTAVVTVESLDGSGIKASATIEVEAVTPVDPVDMVATYNFGKPSELTPTQDVNEDNNPACEVNNVEFISGPITLIPYGGSTSPRLWYNSSKGTQLRLYNGGHVSISCADDQYEIATVEFIGQQLDAIQFEGTAFSDNESVVFTASAGVQNVIFDCVTNGSHKRADISGITVTYKEKSGDTEIKAEKVEISEKEVVLKVDESVTLTAKVYPENAAYKTITWTSDNESVARVDATGKVSAISVGEANITASCGSVSAVCKVTVETSIVNIPVEQIVLNQESARLKVGESVILVATVTPDDATNKDLSWSSSNEQVATVDQSGKVTALESGTAVVTVESLDGSGIKASATIEVEAVTPVDPVDMVATYNFGKPSELTPTQDVNEDNNPACEVNNVEFISGPITLIPYGGSTSPRLWYNSSKGTQLRLYNGGHVSISCADDQYEIATVEFIGQQLDAIQFEGTAFSDNESVVFTASAGVQNVIFDCVTNGSHKRADISGITVTYKEKSGDEEIKAEKVEISDKEVALIIGESYQLEATVSPENATDKTIEWSSSSSDIVSVDASGRLTALAIGNATITAACGSVSATCEVSVSPIMVESITVTPDEWSGVEGDSIQLTAIVSPENATNKELNWSSSNDEVATVDETGLVVINNQGSCIITVRATDGSEIEAQCYIVGTSGIEYILGDFATKVDVYEIGGLLVKKDCDKEGLKMLTPGTYILKDGNKVVKVILK